VKRTDRLIAVALFVGTLVAVALAARHQGTVRDEGTYFQAGESYANWYVETVRSVKSIGTRFLVSFSPASVRKHFEINNEHPALMKTLFGLSHWLFHKTLGWLSPEEAFRLPTHVLFALLAVCLYGWGVRLFESRAAGLTAALLTVAAPRLFFDAQLACFDAPIAAMWVFVVYGYHRALTDPRWGWRTGVLFGLALATKHNAFFLPFVLLAHYLWAHRRTLRALKMPPIPSVFLWMAVVGPLVYLACWPWLWFDTVARFRAYVAFHVNHVYYNMEYLGTNYSKPPFPISFPYVMTLLTVPLTTLLLFAGGVVTMLRRAIVDDRARARHKATSEAGPTPSMARPLAGMSTAPGALLLMNVVFPMAIITVTKAPIFGATKHWHASIPFMALFAGGAVAALAGALVDERDRRRALIAGALTAVVALPAILETQRSHPYGLTHYNVLAGGPAGGADLGMNRQFWGYATRGLLPWLNAHAPPNAPIYWHDTGWIQQAYNVKEKRQRPDLRDTGLEEPGVRASNLAMVIHEKHFNKYEYWIWDFYGTVKPETVLTVEGVPVVTLYRRPNTPLK
jgi:hypothetical protein